MCVFVCARARFEMSKVFSLTCCLCVRACVRACVFAFALLPGTHARVRAAAVRRLLLHHPTSPSYPPPHPSTPIPLSLTRTTSLTITCLDNVHRETGA